MASQAIAQSRGVHPAGAARIDAQWLFLLPATLYLLAFFVVPLGGLLLHSIVDPDLTLRHYLRAFSEPVYMQVTMNTLKLASLVTIISLFLSYPLAYVMSDLPPNQFRLVLALVAVPFWTSILVRSYAWLVILQREGIINKTLLYLGVVSSPLPLAYDTFGVVCGVTYIMVPYMVLCLHSVMCGIDPTLSTVARTLGASQRLAFWRIYLPLSMPGIYAGCSLVFVLTLGYFITPALLGGPRDTTIAMLVDIQMNQVLNWGFGSALAVLLLAFVIILIAVLNRCLRLEQTFRT